MCSCYSALDRKPLQSHLTPFNEYSRKITKEHCMRVNHKTFRCWENPLLGKYSLAYIARDLFGSWNVVNARGKAGEAAKELASTPCQSWEEAVQLFRATHQQNLHYGYQPTCVNL